MRRNLQPHPCHDLLCRTVELLPIYAAKAAERVEFIEHDILGYAGFCDDLNLLIDNADTLIETLSIVAEIESLVGVANLAGVGLIDPGHDFDQRALAGPVLSYQRMDLPRCK